MTGLSARIIVFLYALVFAPWSGAAAQSAQERAELNVLARDFAIVVEAMTPFFADLDRLSAGVLAMNEAMVLRDVDEALAEARRALRETPSDFDESRRRFEALDWAGLRATRFAEPMAEVEAALLRYPAIAAEIHAHLLRQIEAGERRDRAALAELAVASTSFNLPLAESGVLMNRAFLFQIEERNPQHGVNASYLAVAQAQVDIMRAFADGPRGAEAAIASSRAAATAIRGFVARSEQRLSEIRALREAPDAAMQTVGDRPLLDWLDDYERLFRKSYAVELSFADEYEAMAAAIEDIAAGRGPEAASQRLLMVDRRMAALFAERMRQTEDAAEIMSAFRDLEL
ncbi:MAG: hypothetical protein AAFN79_06640 [Pseudomonadota bacterium]